ncbi:Smr/MutS family protein [Zoogloea sp.]|uniref:Smr/MutS family protein n=1 Tax=Zoogloea sp. TaxID=49181 RepID=UPI0035B17AE9
MAKDKTPSPFAALKALRNTLPSPAKPGRGKASSKQPTEGAPTSAAEADLALFHKEIGGVRRLQAPERAEPGRPRPTPIPRPQKPEHLPEPIRPRVHFDPNDPAALFRASLGEVAPIKDFNRADLSAQRARPLLDALGSQATPGPAAVLPEEVLNDPARLFRQLAGAVQPLKDKGLAEINKPQPAPRPIKREEDEQSVLRETLEAPLSFEDRLDMGDEAAYLRTGLPRRVLTDLRRGRWVVQAELDLHGMNRDEARASLAQFIALALHQGKRCLRVVHGRGHGSPGRIPILKQLSRGWLAQREDILAFCQAKPHDGGEGALLVLLQAGQGRPT